MALIFVLLGCTSSRPLKLAGALELQAPQPPKSVIAGERLEVRYSLRNTTTESLQLCSAGGVSMVLRSVSGARWPMVLHGLTTDTDCSGPITLEPGEERIFVESGGVRRDWPLGEAAIVGYFTVWCARGRRCVEATLERPMRVVVARRHDV
ncbi:MAG: hypothetical protein ABI779_08980 [Acidobacteriota bacterium]